MAETIPINKFRLELILLYGRNQRDRVMYYDWVQTAQDVNPKEFAKILNTIAEKILEEVK